MKGKFDAIEQLKNKKEYINTINTWKRKMDLTEKQLKNKTVLDAGCGIGYNACYFSPTAKKIYAIDTEQRNIMKAKEKYMKKNIYFMLGDIEQTSFKNSIFDVVYGWWVVEHLRHPKRFIDEAYRILKPKGILILVTPNIKNFSGGTSKIFPHGLQVKLFNRLQKESDKEHDYYKCYLRANSVGKLDKICSNKFKRIYLERFDNPEYVRYSKILFYLWCIKHKMINNNLLSWMFPSFYVEYISMKDRNVC